MVKNPKIKKYQKSLFSNNFFCWNFFLWPKKHLSSEFSNIRRTRFDQISPVQRVSDFRERGTLNVTEADGQKKSSIPLI